MTSRPRATRRALLPLARPRLSSPRPAAPPTTTAADAASNHAPSTDAAPTTATARPPRSPPATARRRRAGRRPVDRLEPGPPGRRRAVRRRVRQLQRRHRRHRVGARRRGRHRRCRRGAGADRCRQRQHQPHRRRTRANPGSSGNYYLVVHEGSGIETVADLRGKKVAYPPGTGRHMIVAAVLADAGLSLTEDVTPVELAGSEVAPTFAAGAVDAAIVLGYQWYNLGEPPDHRRRHGLQHRHQRPDRALRCPRRPGQGRRPSATTCGAPPHAQNQVIAADPDGLDRGQLRRAAGPHVRAGQGARRRGRHRPLLPDRRRRRRRCSSASPTGCSPPAASRRPSTSPSSSIARFNDLVIGPERGRRDHPPARSDRPPQPRRSTTMTITEPRRVRPRALDVRPLAGHIGAEIHGVDLSRPLDAGHRRRHPHRPGCAGRSCSSATSASTTPATSASPARSATRRAAHPLFDASATPTTPPSTRCSRTASRPATTRRGFDHVPVARRRHRGAEPAGGLDPPRRRGPRRTAATRSSPTPSPPTRRSRRRCSASPTACAPCTASGCPTPPPTTTAAATPQRPLVTEHPVVRVHPETGERALYVNPSFTTHLVGVSPHESRRLLALFYETLALPAAHRPLPLGPGQRRLLGQPRRRPPRATRHRPPRRRPSPLPRHPRRRRPRRDRRTAFDRHRGTAIRCALTRDRWRQPRALSYRPTARSSSALFIFERPSMFCSLASL